MFSEAHVCTCSTVMLVLVACDQFRNLFFMLLVSDEGGDEARRPESYLGASASDQEAEGSDCSASGFLFKTRRATKWKRR